MVTPFTNDDRLDREALEAMVEWYLARGVDGLFAVCQSSEMFFLTLPERVALAKAVVDFAGGRAEVIASGHISDSLDNISMPAPEEGGQFDFDGMAFARVRRQKQRNAMAGW